VTNLQARLAFDQGALRLRTLFAYNLLSALNALGLVIGAAYLIWRYTKKHSTKWLVLNGWLCFVIWWDVAEILCEAFTLKKEQRQDLMSIICGESLRGSFVGVEFGIGLLIIAGLFIALKELCKGAIKWIREMRRPP